MFSNLFNTAADRRENSIENHGDAGQGSAFKIIVISFIILAAVFAGVVWLIDSSL